MSEVVPPPQSRRTKLLGLLAAAAIAVLGLFGLLWLFQTLGYGWDKPKGRAVPALILFFVGGIVAFQRRRSLALRALALIVVTALAVPAWWLTPQNHVSLREAARWRDELKTALSSPPTFEQAFMADNLRIKRDELKQASPSMAHQTDMDRWADEVAETVAERFRKTSAEDTADAVHTHHAFATLTNAFSGSWCIMCPAENDWIDRAVAARQGELERLSEGDWAGFDHTAARRHTLADAFPGSREQLISAERKWMNETVTAHLHSIQMNPKLMRETCHETERQLLALKSLDESPERFREARELLFRTALDSAQTEIRNHIEAGRSVVAYGIARKLAVDWFATAEMLGHEQQKRLEELRDRCRNQVELAENEGELPELAPTPRIRETAPAPRLKP